MIKVDFNVLYHHLKNLSYQNFKDEEGIKKAHSILDIERFKDQYDASTITLDRVILRGHPFLVDAVGNDLSVCLLTEKKFRNQSGRAVNSIFQKTIIDDCKSVYGSPLNGYWAIPDKFLK